MKKKRAFLLLNGEPPKKLPNLSKYDVICATDGAYKFLKDHKITPHFISGDFDSLTEVPKEIKTIYTPNQNFTDFDKIAEILYKMECYHIDVYGASGKEQDHFLGNLHTVVSLKNKLNFTFIDNYSTYYLAAKKTIIKNCNNKIISLFPFPKTENITTSGLQFNLLNEDLTFGKKIGTRNKAIDNLVEIKFESGNLFIFIKH